MKKLKLVIGKCLERASTEIYNDNEPVFKFAIDREDYENDIDHKKKEAEFFELLNKSPPVPDQKGLKNARARLREFQAVDPSSPMKERVAENFGNMSGEEFNDFMILLKSEYYKDFADKNGEVDFAVDDEEEYEESEKEFDKEQMPPNILKGIALLFKRIWEEGKKKRKKKRRKRSRSRSRSRSIRSRGSYSSRSPRKRRKKTSPKKSRRGRGSPLGRSSRSREGSLNWNKSRPIFGSPGEGTGSPSKRGQATLLFSHQDPVSPEFEDGPTLEDTYSIPKSRKKVKRRVPKKTGAYGSPKRSSKR